MSEPQRIQRKRTKGWQIPEGAVYVGRPSRWSNPFYIWREHHLAGPSWSLARESWSHIPAAERTALYVTSSQPIQVGEVVHKFRQLMTIRLRDEPSRLTDWLAPLAGHDLACWCPLDKPCHADVLLELANGATS